MSTSVGRFVWLVMRDQALLALGGGIIVGIFAGETAGFSLAAAGIWLALNFAALSWLISAVITPQRVSRLFIFGLACAKIPASYLILYWLCRAEYFAPTWLAVGFASLPVVLLYRGILSRPVASPSEEG